MATFKKKSMRLNEMLENKLVREGDLLRYKVHAPLNLQVLSEASTLVLSQEDSATHILLPALRAVQSHIGLALSRPVAATS